MSSSKQVILAALEDHVYHMIEAGQLEREVLNYVPESHVFFADEMCGYDEGDFESIRMVGENDVQAKINFYSRLIDEAAQHNSEES